MAMMYGTETSKSGNFDILASGDINEAVGKDINTSLRRKND